MRNVPLLTALVSLLAGAPALLAQRVYPRAGVLALEVRDEQGHAVARARVSVARAGNDLTDGSGRALITGIGAGNRLVQVTREGYEVFRIAADFTPDDTTRLSVVMKAQPIELEGVTATSWGRSTRLRQNGFYHRQRMGFGAFMTADEIERINPLRTTELFRRMRGFVVVPMPGASGHDIVYTTRSLGDLHPCPPRVYLDGAPLSRTGRDQVDLLEIIHPSDVAAIEGYASPATIPAEYNATGGACGVILIWTKTGEERRRS